jgi:predicted DNA-binding protein (MmcQ/YjbR family)
VDVSRLEELCLALPGAWPDHPWEHEHPVIKVGEGERGRIFAFLGADRVGIKAGPSREAADEWLQRYPDDASVMPYIGRSGWNNLRLDSAIPDEEVVEAVEESYRLVVAKLPRSRRPAGWDRV